MFLHISLQKSFSGTRVGAITTQKNTAIKATFWSILCRGLRLDELNVISYKTVFCAVLASIRLKKIPHPLFIRTVLVSHRDVQKD